MNVSQTDTSTEKKLNTYVNLFGTDYIIKPEAVL